MAGQHSEILVSAWQQACSALSHSYSPYSRFAVGAGLFDQNGRIYQGCNVENATYGATVCAERTAFLKAVSEGTRTFSGIVIVTDTIRPTPPCALCLQTMAEFCSPNFMIYLANLQGITEKHRFKDLLTHPFGPSYLLDGVDSVK